MRRISSNIVVICTALLLASISSAQQKRHENQTNLAGNASLTGANGPPIGGGGSPNYIPIWVDSSNLGNSAIYQNGAGNIGIGTPDPAARLDVNGGINARMPYQIGGKVVLSTGSPGRFNLSVGPYTGLKTTSGFSNTFTGFYAGYSNALGWGNTFNGVEAGYSDTSGFANTFTGLTAGYSTTFGCCNSFYGVIAGYSNTTGQSNTYIGSGTGFSDTTASRNTFTGVNAGYNGTTGSENTFYGFEAGYNNTTGNSNIYIGNYGPPSGTEGNTIRIGFPLTFQGCFGQPPCGQNAAYIAGIYGTTSAGGVPVYINSDGQLGTQSSSLRFKEQIRDMGDNTNALMKLRPVTFFYKPEYDRGERTLQYGLIAEEVAEVYPDLVANDNAGQPYTVRYQYLTTMLLNEAQKQQRRAEAEAKVVTALQQRIEELEQRLLRLERLVGNQQTVAQK